MPPYNSVALPSANVYETHRFSIVSCLDHMYQISHKPENECGKYRAIFIYALKKPWISLHPFS